MENALETRNGWAGVDEAGRGPLAGPVVAAAVVLPPHFQPGEITDSKQMSPLARRREAKRIKQECIWAISVVDVEDIDRLNILGATMLAMRRAIRRIRAHLEGVLVDGNRHPDGIDSPVECCVRGDATLLQIAAASVLAKTHRDQIMSRMAKKFPGYGFEHNFGYATPEHLMLLRRLGPCDIHRRSFAPVRELLEQPCLDFEM